MSAKPKTFTYRKAILVSFINSRYVSIMKIHKNNTKNKDKIKCLTWLIDLQHDTVSNLIKLVQHFYLIEVTGIKVKYKINVFNITKLNP